MCVRGCNLCVLFSCRSKSTLRLPFLPCTGWLRCVCVRVSVRACLTSLWLGVALQLQPPCTVCACVRVCCVCVCVLPHDSSDMPEDSPQDVTHDPSNSHHHQILQHLARGVLFVLLLYIKQLNVLVWRSMGVASFAVEYKSAVE